MLLGTIEHCNPVQQICCRNGRHVRLQDWTEEIRYFAIPMIFGVHSKVKHDRCQQPSQVLPVMAIGIQ